MAYVIGRKEGEHVWVGDTKITVLKISGSRVRLSMEGPTSTKIIRGGSAEEILDSQENHLPILRASA